LNFADRKDEKGNNNMNYSRSITEIIRQRFSCRAYLEKPIDVATIQKLQSAMDSYKTGPLASALRFKMIAATEEDRSSLKGVGTYGKIKNPQGFIVGAATQSPKDLEDYGYALERLVLHATDLGLGSCWLGGGFTKSGFAKKIEARSNECVPAVISLGYIENIEKAKNAFVRKRTGGHNRIPWEQQFFNESFKEPISVEQAGNYENALEMVRLGPSASNKQPWRIIKKGDSWHFYLQRTKGYGTSIVFKLLKIADIQRLDMGIAMCHFELTAHQMGLQGSWKIEDPGIEKPDELTEYTVSWKS
jgi:nitroreductase